MAHPNPSALNPNSIDWPQNPTTDPGHKHSSTSLVTPLGTPTAITGALSTVTDTAAKAVLTSIIGACVAGGVATNGTT